jgi:hypothetical protein
LDWKKLLLGWNNQLSGKELLNARLCVPDYVIPFIGWESRQHLLIQQETYLVSSGMWFFITLLAVGQRLIT